MSVDNDFREIDAIAKESYVCVIQTTRWFPQIIQPSLRGFEDLDMLHHNVIYLHEKGIV